ncbi:MAG: DUF1906 domain-containing protein [Nannocystaceae bacterium]
MRWGVDSYGPADAEQQVPEALRRDGEDHHSHISRLELVTRRMGRAPTFWGRYLNQRLPQHDGTVESPPGEHRLTPREVAWLHAQGCRVLPVYNGSGGRTDRLTGGRTAGAAAANQAIALCEQLEVPASVIVYADVENWAGDVGWFRGWFETMRGANWRCGVYGRPIRVVEEPRGSSTPLRHRAGAHPQRRDPARGRAPHRGRDALERRSCASSRHHRRDLERRAARGDDRGAGRRHRRARRRSLRRPRRRRVLRGRTSPAGS